MSERWKPESNEIYYYISESLTVKVDCNKNAFIDIERICWGNCFRTEAKAKDSAAKVRALLLSLHEPTKDRNQLPKLTTEVFDRPDCPEWATYVAVDRGGMACFFDKKPKCDNIQMWLRGEEGEHFMVLRNSKWDASDWHNSLIERPTKLSKWCKVGEWCFCLDDGNCKYFKITKIKDNFIYGEDCVIDYHFVKQARLRPYNAEEMRGLVGMVICKGRSVHFVTGYEDVFDGEGMVHVNGGLYSANDLLQKGFTYDTRPCGRLEHLNDEGEWVA